jgi:hypothetical protein
MEKRQHNTTNEARAAAIAETEGSSRLLLLLTMLVLCLACAQLGAFGFEV